LEASSKKYLGYGPSVSKPGICIEGYALPLRAKDKRIGIQK